MKINLGNTAEAPTLLSTVQRQLHKKASDSQAVVAQLPTAEKTAERPRSTFLDGLSDERKTALQDVLKDYDLNNISVDEVVGLTKSLILGGFVDEPTAISFMTNNETVYDEKGRQTNTGKKFDFMAVAYKRNDATQALFASGGVIGGGNGAIVMERMTRLAEALYQLSDKAQQSSVDETA